MKFLYTASYLSFLNEIKSKENVFFVCHRSPNYLPGSEGLRNRFMIPSITKVECTLLCHLASLFPSSSHVIKAEAAFSFVNLGMD